MDKVEAWASSGGVSERDGVCLRRGWSSGGLLSVQRGILRNETSGLPLVEWSQVEDRGCPWIVNRGAAVPRHVKRARSSSGGVDGFCGETFCGGHHGPGSTPGEAGRTPGASIGRACSSSVPPQSLRGGCGQGGCGIVVGCVVVAQAGDRRPVLPAGRGGAAQSEGGQRVCAGGQRGRPGATGRGRGGGVLWSKKGGCNLPAGSIKMRPGESWREKFPLVGSESAFLANGVAFARPVSMLGA